MSGALIPRSFIAIFCLLLAGCQPSGTIPRDAHPWLTELDWMCGDWVTENEETGSLTEEHWMTPLQSNMFGLGRTMRNGREVFIEYLRIAVEGPDVVYYAAPGGRLPATPFRAVEHGPSRAVFENPEHDFPQRIIYELQPGGAIRVRIEGDVDGERRSSEWLFSPDI